MTGRFISNEIVSKCDPDGMLNPASREDELGQCCQFRLQEENPKRHRRSSGRFAGAQIREIDTGTCRIVLLAGQ
jgi:hypothetical protein